jgi:maltooligosyltrehalose trehalohydrolase
MQNHDQVGNRLMGERIAALLPPAKVRLAAAATILAPFVPMLFMGEEYGETAPFQYFTSHSDPDLIEAVRKGRREEFDDFIWEGEPPDPHDEETFRRSKLNSSLRERDEHAEMWELYRTLLALRRETPALRNLDLGAVETHADDERRVLLVRRGDTLTAFNFAEEPQTVKLPFRGTWRPLLASGTSITDEAIAMPPFAFAVFAGAV